MSEPELVSDRPLTELERLKADCAVHQLKRIRAAREVNILKADLRKAHRKIHEQRKQLRSLGSKWATVKRATESERLIAKMRVQMRELHKKAYPAGRTVREMAEELEGTIER
jgi:hypothetical protein